MPDSFEALLCVAYGLVPGYVFFSVYGAIAVRETRSTSAQIIESIAASLAYWVLAAPLLLDFKDGMGPRVSLALISAAGVLLPAIAGIGAGHLEMKGWLRRALGIRSATPTAWDHLFGLKKPLWVVVTLNDGSRIGGGWHEQSFASSYPNDRDLYIEAVFQMNENGGMIAPIARTAGAWIPAASIKCLEFFNWEVTSDRGE